MLIPVEVLAHDATIVGPWHAGDSSTHASATGLVVVEPMVAVDCVQLTGAGLRKLAATPTGIAGEQGMGAAVWATDATLVSVSAVILPSRSWRIPLHVRPVDIHSTYSIYVLRACSHQHTLYTIAMHGGQS
jgi:hypothetical protein